MGLQTSILMALRTVLNGIGRKARVERRKMVLRSRGAKTCEQSVKNRLIGVCTGFLTTTTQDVAAMKASPEVSTVNSWETEGAITVSIHTNGINDVSNVMTVVIGGFTGQSSQCKSTIASTKESSQTDKPLDMVIFEVDTCHVEG